MPMTFGWEKHHHQFYMIQNQLPLMQHSSPYYMTVHTFLQVCVFVFWWGFSFPLWCTGVLPFSPLCQFSPCLISPNAMGCRDWSVHGAFFCFMGQPPVVCTSLCVYSGWADHIPSNFLRHGWASLGSSLSWNSPEPQTQYSVGTGGHFGVSRWEC